jgi:phosphopantothenoylcysteine decarboxylase/phosphopantothenate--cysteine ligase
VLVTTAEQPIPPGVRPVRVETAAQMEATVTAEAAEADVVVMAAAVADFRPISPSARKIKKEAGTPTVELEKTPDILAGLGARKRPGQVLVGFAAETDDVVANAKDKLSRKNLDLIVANDVAAPGTGFEHDTNAVIIVAAAGTVHDVSLTDKRSVARAVLDAVVEHLALRPPSSGAPVNTSSTREPTEVGS